MKIGIDARIIFRRGVGRYISNLIKNILEIDRENKYFIYLAENSILYEYFDFKNCFFKRLNTANGFFYEQFYLPKAAATDGVDILHCTDNTAPFLYPFYRGKIVVTIHDTMHIRDLKSAIARPTLKQILIDRYKKLGVPASAKKADTIITVSNYSKTDIIKNLKIDEKKIKVIKEGVDKKFKVINNKNMISKVLQKYSITKPYILTTGAADVRKNTIRAIEAFNIFNNLTEYKYQMVITSINPKELETTNIIQKIRELNLEKYIVLTGYVPDDDLVTLYNGALFFLFPSIWEGFGLQVLEAFACGLPVIASSITSIKEVAEDAALYIDPFSVEDIVRGMIELEKSESKMQTLIAKGFKQVEKFSWETNARETLEVYKELYMRMRDE
ncbi:MAG: glycosyltransferase family 4 protein [Candidatus Goldbacteria bacterium]|nr:glycosyltransferase family 4 protein [Candidatus Goldiibacteriota bacterium]